MARKSDNKTTLENYFSQVKWGESYTSLFLGAVVVIVALVLVFSFLRSKNFKINLNDNSTNSVTPSEDQLANNSRTYVVKEGDNLWSIAEKRYGSGYNWVDLVNANKLVNSNVLYVGTKLTVPNVKVRALTVNQSQTQQTNPIRGTSYKVVKGDYLWAIALRAYGDGYRWVDIAKANNLTNPDLIYSEITLRLPR